ncbi:MAG: hypothetical protein GX053_08660 [Tissierella sp.]|nr:hypothetical protein [Tissierella sp.]
MKRKIHVNVAVLSTSITILVAVFMLMTFYRFHTDNQMNSLKNTGNLISNILISSDVSDINELDQLKHYKGTNTRITLLNRSGDVVFDNMADTKNMENHRDRPEFLDAIENSQGESIRYSATMGYDTYYYALKLQNNLILRVSYQTENIFNMFSLILPVIVMIVILISIISYYTSFLLANHILKPINILTKNLEGNFQAGDLEELSVYDEISPFIRTFKNQNKLILDRNIELEEKANLLDVISSSMGEGIILLDINTKIISINKSGIKLFNGRNNVSLAGQDFIRLCRDLNLNEALEIAIEEKSSKEIIIHHNSKYLDVYINPVLREQRLTGLLLLVVDTTEKHKLDLMRREFSANVSHELKTPLTSINGYAEMIESGMVKGEDITKFASIIRKEGGRLLNLIGDIIKLSKIEDDANEKKLEPINVYFVGKEAISTLESLALDKDIELELTGESSFIMGNKGMLQDLIYNLLENSIKYTNPGGSIQLSVVHNNLDTIVKIKDTGIGIPSEHQDRIFERFYIVDKSRSKKNQSTGLGLSIVKHIVEYHNGKIHLESEVGKGTKITIKFKSI